ncbi:Uncharacterized protein TCM_001848 [Theobroma cacao]|uniref:Secreted protein n=1 Tax=Theobroma cacao TaxID=3641 RepID=A0A061DKL8_THECC|nr:Uncharacterized protein TCM_001848 [Theobroma cacao]
MIFTLFVLSFCTSAFTGLENSLPSISAKISAPPEKAFFTTNGPSQFGVHFPRGSCWFGRILFNTNSPSRNCRECAFLSYALIILF